MRNLKMFCICLEPNHYNFIKELGYIPVGLGEKVFNKGDVVTFKPGSSHSSHTKDGCLILVFMRTKNKPI